MTTHPYHAQTPCHVGILWKPSANGEIIIRTPRHQLICLTCMGTDIFTRCNGKTPISEIQKFLEKKYSHMPTHHIGSELYRFLQWLESLGVIIIDWDDF
jgi:hypothetical protein